MMMNLFSIFDPSNSIMSMSWLMMTTPTMMMSFHQKFKINSKMKNIMKTTLKYAMKEMKTLMSNTKKKGTLIIMKHLFTTIMLMNFLALYPFNFTPTAHMSINFPLALTMWTSLNMMGWSNSMKKMISHLVPLNTPYPLMNFMVMIELISNIIRPITLSVRLSANMMAGHLLMSLLSNFSSMSMNKMYLSTIPLLTLTMLEMMVSIIQAYVFITLLSLYHNEILYDK